MKKIFKYSVFILLLMVIAAYTLFLFGLPRIVQSRLVMSKIENILYQKFNVKLSINGIEYKTHPNLSSNLLIKKIILSSFDGNTIFESENIYGNINPPTGHSSLVKIDYIFLNKTLLPELKFKQGSGKKQKINLNHLPELKISKADFIIDTNTKMTIKDLSVKKIDNKFVIKFESKINSNYIKDAVTTKKNGSLIFYNNSLNAENFDINIANSKLVINGKIFDKENGYNFTLTGKNLPVYDIEKGFLYFIKKKNRQKNFIENFYDFSGLADINLVISPENIMGKAVTRNLSAKTVKFSIPISLPYTEFKFSGNKITAESTGKFGNEKVFTDFSADKLFTPEKIVSGTVKANLSDKFSDLYAPEIKITGHLNALVKYHVYKGNTVVEYFAGIPEGTNVDYQNSNLGLMEQNRRVYAKTYKQGNNLYLKKYDYSFINNGIVENILLGEGLFIKENGKFKLDYITCKTNGEAPVSVTGSFGKYIEGGTFKGDLKYNYPKNLLTGHMHLYNSKYKDFYVNEASVTANESTMEIKSYGTYTKSPFKGYINMKNRFEDEITINNLNLYLKEYVIKRNRPKANRPVTISPETTNIKWTIKNGQLKLDKLRYKKIVLENMELDGNLTNDIVDFTMTDIDFADGHLAATGKYNIKDHSSDIKFDAKDINSNNAAKMIFNLHNQIEGSANATMHLKTYNKLETICAHTDFSIEDGALTKIGSTEFMIKKSKKFIKNIKFTLPEIINIDVSRMKALKSDIKGSFDMHNHKIKNIEIFTRHKYLSLYTEGSYNIRRQNANIRVWGKYNRNAQKGIRILFVPLSMVTKILFKPEYTKTLYQDKLDKIPSIQAKEKEIENFTVRMNGNLNDNLSIKVEFKSIR